MARAVVPCTAAAVDHADTELIGQTKTPDFLVVFLIGLFTRKYENIPAISLYILLYTLIFELAIAKQGEGKNKALIKTGKMQ